MKNKKKILIIEDDTSLSRILEGLLEESDFEVFKAEDGISGLELVFKEHPNLTLLDIILPKKDGIAFLKELRKDEWGKTAHVMIMSNTTEPDKVLSALEGGINDFIAKSEWQPADIVKRIKEKLNS